MAAAGTGGTALGGTGDTAAAGTAGTAAAGTSRMAVAGSTATAGTGEKAMGMIVIRKQRTALAKTAGAAPTMATMVAPPPPPAKMTAQLVPSQSTHPAPAQRQS
jgi:hypothetical protein